MRFTDTELSFSISKSRIVPSDVSNHGDAVLLKREKFRSHFQNCSPLSPKSGLS